MYRKTKHPKSVCLKNKFTKPEYVNTQSALQASDWILACCHPLTVTSGWTTGTSSPEPWSRNARTCIGFTVIVSTEWWCAWLTHFWDHATVTIQNNILQWNPYILSVPILFFVVVLLQNHQQKLGRKGNEVSWYSKPSQPQRIYQG